MTELYVTRSGFRPVPWRMRFTMFYLKWRTRMWLNWTPSGRRFARYTKALSRAMGDYFYSKDAR